MPSSGPQSRCDRELARVELGIRREGDKVKFVKNEMWGALKRDGQMHTMGRSEGSLTAGAGRRKQSLQR